MNFSNFLFLVFDLTLEKNKNLQLYAQQIKSLCLKRLLIFSRRYIIALCALFLPVIVQALLSKYIPSTSLVITNAFDSLINRKHIPTYKMDILNYGKQKLPYSVNDNVLETQFVNYFENRQIKNSKNSKLIELVSVKNMSLNDFVYAKRLSNLKNIYGDYFVGMSLQKDESNELRGILYYSTLVFHSAGSILNEMNSFMLAYYTNNSKKSITTINAPVTVLENSSSNFSFGQLQVLNCIEAMPFSFIDFIDGVIVAFIISVCTIHVTREKRNGSKFLQLLSGTHYITYWASNYLFDVLVFFINISTIILALKLVSLTISDTANDTLVLANDGLTLFNLFTFMFFCSFSWATLAYIWSFIFKSDVIAFLTLFLVLGCAVFFDMILVIVGFFNAGLNDSFRRITEGLRIFFSIFFPNVTVKRAIYNLKLQHLDVCLLPMNLLLNCKIILFVCKSYKKY